MELLVYAAGLALIIIGVCTLSFLLVIAGIMFFIIPAIWD